MNTKLAVPLLLVLAGLSLTHEISGEIELG